MATEVLDTIEIVNPDPNDGWIISVDFEGLTDRVGNAAPSIWDEVASYGRWVSKDGLTYQHPFIERRHPILAKIATADLVKVLRNRDLAVCVFERDDVCAHVAITADDDFGDVFTNAELHRAADSLVEHREAIEESMMSAGFGAITNYIHTAAIFDQESLDYRSYCEAKKDVDETPLSLEQWRELNVAVSYFLTDVGFRVVVKDGNGQQIEEHISPTRNGIPRSIVLGAAEAAAQIIANRHGLADDQVTHDTGREQEFRPLTISQKRTFLEKQGFVIGDREPRLNTKHAGRFMVVEAFEESELPTEDGANGPWCVVGDDLDAMIASAFDVWGDEMGAFGATPAALLNMDAATANSRKIVHD